MLVACFGCFKFSEAYRVFFPGPRWCLHGIHYACSHWSLASWLCGTKFWPRSVVVMLHLLSNLPGRRDMHMGMYVCMYV